MRSVMNMVVAAIAGGVLLWVVLAPRPAADWVLFNGKVFTSNAKQPHAEALAIRGERIVAVGSSQEISALAGKDTKKIDLGGRTVIPGINDAHFHLETYPDGYVMPITKMDPDWQEEEDWLREAVKKTPKGTWIYGGFGPAILENSQATGAALDELAPDHHVLLGTFDGHAALVNTAAMRKLGVREDLPDPEGGRYRRNPVDGRFTGLVLEYAAWSLFCHWSSLTPDPKAEKDLHEFFASAARMGITTVQDIAMPIIAQRAVDLLEKAPPPIRVRVIRSPMTGERGLLMQEGRGLPHNPAPLVTVSGTKWRVDGTPFEHTASMREPYTDQPNTSGDLEFSPNEVEAILRDSLQSGEQLVLHVVGDRAVENVLNAMEATGGEKVWSSRRVRIEHADGLMLDLLPRAKRLGVMVVRNPTVSTIGELFMKRFGKERSQKLILLRSLLKAGIHVAIGSDGPLNPYLNILMASTYDQNPAEAITREQAVIAYTLGSAWSEFAENVKGTLEPGKLADLVVLSQDIFKVFAGDLPKTESVMTMVGGKVVYDAKVVTLR